MPISPLFAHSLRLVSTQVFAGDKYGHIALWDATNAGEAPPTSNGSIRQSKKEEVTDEDDGEVAGEEETDEEPSKGKFWLWQAHQKSSVSSLKFRPHDTKKVSVSLSRSPRRVCSRTNLTDLC